MQDILEDLEDGDTIFKCRCCGEKYSHFKMASDDDISICKWCSGDLDNDDEETIS